MKIVELTAQLNLITTKLNIFSQKLQKHPQQDQKIDYLSFKDLKKLHCFTKFTQNLLETIGFSQPQNCSKCERNSPRSVLKPIFEKLNQLEEQIKSLNQPKPEKNTSLQNSQFMVKMTSFDKKMKMLNSNMEEFAQTQSLIQSTINKNSLKDLKKILQTKNALNIEKSCQTFHSSKINDSVFNPSLNKLLIPPEGKLQLVKTQQCRKFEDVLCRVFINPEEVQIRSFGIQSFDQTVSKNMMIYDKGCYFVANQDDGIQSIQRVIPSGKLQF